MKNTYKAKLLTFAFLILGTIGSSAQVLKNKIIVIDPGHGMGNRSTGVYDPGAVGTLGGDSNAQEAGFALANGLELRTRFQAAGATVYMTRQDATTNTPLTSRDEFMVNKRADVAFAIHLNAFTTTSAAGTATEVDSQNNSNSVSDRFATIMQSNLVEQLKIKDRGVGHMGLAAIPNYSSFPAVLTEGLFVSNPSELALIKSTDGFNSWVSAHENAVYEWFGFDAPAQGPSLTAPELYVANSYGVDGVNLKWKSSVGSNGAMVTGYKVYYAFDDKTNWKLAKEVGNVAEVSINSKSDFSVVPSNNPKHYKVVAVGTGEGKALESADSEILSRYSGTIDFNVLLVGGIDRVDDALANTSDQYFLKYIWAIAAAKTVNISTTQHSYVQNGDVEMSKYDAVVWILGDESSNTSTFVPEEMSKIKSYTEAGGNFFVSGENVGYDLIAKGDATDEGFYSDYLKASYVADGGTKTTVSGLNIFNGVTISLGDTYSADDADDIAIANGSSLIMDAGGKGAGIFYKGVFGSSSKTGSVLYLSFGLESASTVDMTKVFDVYFDNVDEIDTEQGNSLAATSTSKVYINSAKIYIYHVEDYLPLTTTGDNGGYLDNTSTSMTIDAGKVVSTYITTPWSNDRTSVYGQVWVDTNKDGEFTDDEIIGKSTVASTTPTFDITIPNVAEGDYIIRIAMSDVSNIPSSGRISGEIEDYTLHIKSNTLAIENSEKVQINGYPNPFVNSLNLDVAEGSNVVVYSLAGKVIYQVNNSPDRLNLDTSSWYPGIYLVSVTINNNKEVIKVIKQ